ncbi:hypothetical protein RAA17_13985 [Komagataeibacter rhaeticus]|nr:hypothetical protein [Komagataeibacter rhaeticus]
MTVMEHASTSPAWRSGMQAGEGRARGLVARLVCAVAGRRCVLPRSAVVPSRGLSRPPWQAMPGRVCRGVRPDWLAWGQRGGRGRGSARRDGGRTHWCDTMRM